MSYSSPRFKLHGRLLRQGLMGLLLWFNFAGTSSPGTCNAATECVDACCETQNRHLQIGVETCCSEAPAATTGGMLPLNPPPSDTPVAVIHWRPFSGFPHHQWVWIRLKSAAPPGGGTAVFMRLNMLRC